MRMMAIARIEDIRFNRLTDNKRSLEIGAFHGGLRVGIAVAFLDLLTVPAVEILRFQTESQPDYRRIGIGKHMLDDIIIWSKAKKAKYLHGFIAQSMLLDDTVAHISSSLISLGFTVEDSVFRLDL